MLLVNVSTSSALPPCPSNQTAYYDNCLGFSTNANGDKYVGEYKYNKASGQGTLTYANGNKYVGQFKSNKASGQGTLTYANGNKHVGQFKDNKPSGQGTLTYANGGKYDGAWNDGKYNGQGIYIFANGDKYIGIFEDNKANGQGTLIYGNGNTYISENKGNKENRHFVNTNTNVRVEKKPFEGSRLQYAPKVFPIKTANKVNESLSKGNFKDSYIAESGDFETALQRWKHPAEQGNADAQFNIGWVYQYIQDVPHDYKTAVKWYRLAAEQGHIDAQNYLGAMYEKGRGVPQDDKVAMKWWILAAEQGSIFAQNSLGSAYDFKGDYKAAIKWYKLAAKQGYARAQYNLGFIYDFKQGDYKPALKWYKLAAEQGIERAQRRLQAIKKKFANQSIPLPGAAKINSELPSKSQQELESLRKEIAQLINKEKSNSKPQKLPKKTTSSLGYIVSKNGHVLTNQNIVRNCTRVTVGNIAQNQVATNIIKTDREDGLALLKISSLEIEVVKDKHLVQKRGIRTILLASNNLFHSEKLLNTQLNKSETAKQSIGTSAKGSLDIEAPKVQKFLKAAGLPTRASFLNSISTKSHTNASKRPAILVVCHQ